MSSCPLGDLHASNPFLCTYNILVHACRPSCQRLLAHACPPVPAFCERPCRMHHAFSPDAVPSMHVYVCPASLLLLRIGHRDSRAARVPLTLPWPWPFSPLKTGHGIALALLLPLRPLIHPATLSDPLHRHPTPLPHVDVSVYLTGALSTITHTMIACHRKAQTRASYI